MTKLKEIIGEEKYNSLLKSHSFHLYGISCTEMSCEELIVANGVLQEMNENSVIGMQRVNSMQSDLIKRRSRSFL